MMCGRVAPLANTIPLSPAFLHDDETLLSRQPMNEILDVAPQILGACFAKQILARDLRNVRFRPVHIQVVSSSMLRAAWKAF